MSGNECRDRRNECGILSCQVLSRFLYITCFTVSTPASSCRRLRHNGLACFISACPEAFAQFDNQCVYFRDFPYAKNFGGNPFSRAESFCQSLSHVGVTAHVFVPWSLQSSHFMGHISEAVLDVK